MNEPRVTGLFVYPLKSAAGIALDATRLDAFGIPFDRRWMVVDADGTFLTQRDAPALALVRTSFRDDALRLDAQGLPPLSLSLDGPPGERRPVAVWDDATEGVDSGDAAADWISAVIRRPARILYMPDEVVRPVDPRYDVAGGRVSFADAFPLLLITQASLDGLNARLDRPLPMNRFRPNLVVAGTSPHAEDEWRRIRAGTVDFAVVKPCARCVTTTVDQETGIAGSEPLRTLASYRKVGSKVMFGQNVIHLTQGRVAVGDAVTVLESTAAAGAAPVR